MERMKAPGEARTAAPESRLALIGIIVEDKESAGRINAVLHDYGDYIAGRMGIPYHKRNISIISVVVDAPGDIISALTGKLGMIPHVGIKTVYSKAPAMTGAAAKEKEDAWTDMV